MAWMGAMGLPVSAEIGSNALSKSTAATIENGDSRICLRFADIVSEVGEDWPRGRKRRFGSLSYFFTKDQPIGRKAPVIENGRFIVFNGKRLSRTF